eukprot:5711521-Alexandrium_andersonii.AAC.1
MGSRLLLGSADVAAFLTMESRPACFWQPNSELPFRKGFVGAAGLESASGCIQSVVRWHFGSSPSLRQCSPCVGCAL